MLNYQANAILTVKPNQSPAWVNEWVDEWVDLLAGERAERGGGEQRRRSLAGSSYWGACLSGSVRRGWIPGVGAGVDTGGLAAVNM